MLDHIFLTVSNAGYSIASCERVPPILWISTRLDDGGCRSPAGHRRLTGFGAKGGKFLSPGKGTAVPCATDVGPGAGPESMVDADHAEALAAGASEIQGPRARLHYDPRIHARRVRKPDSHTLELVFKGRQRGR